MTIFLGVLTLIIVGILAPVAKRCRQHRQDSNIDGRVYDIFQVSALSLIVAIAGIFFCNIQVSEINEKIGELTVVVEEEQRQTTLVLGSLTVGVAVLQAIHDPQATLEPLRLNANLLDGYIPAALMEVASVETEPDFALTEFEGGAVGLRFEQDMANGRVRVMAMKQGVIRSVGTDRDPDFPGRFEVVLAHDDGYQTYYGLLSVWSPRLQDQIARTDGPDIQRLVGMEVKRGELLAWAVQGSGISLRLGARKEDGTPISPLKAIGGFIYTAGVKVEK